MATQKLHERLHWIPHLEIWLSTLLAGAWHDEACFPSVTLSYIVLMFGVEEGALHTACTSSPEMRSGLSRLSAEEQVYIWRNVLLGKLSAPQNLE